MSRCPIAWPFLIALRVLLGVAMASSLVGAPNARADAHLPAAQGLAAMTTAEAKARGEALKAELWTIYQELRAAGKLAPLQTDITRYVRPYVTPGSTFRDAEMTLRAAGFTIERPDPGRGSDPNRPRDWSAVLARISSFDDRFPFRTSLYVTLLPGSPGDYSRVETVTASFFMSGP